MEQALIGFFSSLMAGLFFGLYPVPRRYVQLGINDYMISMSLGVLVSGIGASFLMSYTFLDLSLLYIILAIFAGSCWCLATVLYIYAVDCMGIGRATPVKNLTAVLGIIFGLFIFQEYKDLSLTAGIFLVIGTGLLISTGKILGSIQGKEDMARPSCPINLVTPGFIKKGKRNSLTAGWILALGAAFLYAVFSIPVRILSTGAESVFQFLPVVAAGALMTSIILDNVFTSTHNWAKVAIKEHLFAGLGGLIWALAFIGLATGIKNIGISIGWPLANSSTIFSVIYAVFIAREISFSRKRSTIITGLMLGIVGIIFLGLSM